MPKQSTATPYPPISDTTGIATPDFSNTSGMDSIPGLLIPTKWGVTRRLAARCLPVRTMKGIAAIQAVI